MRAAYFGARSLEKVAQIIARKQAPERAPAVHVAFTRFALNPGAMPVIRIAAAVLLAALMAPPAVAADQPSAATIQPPAQPAAPPAAHMAVTHAASHRGNCLSKAEQRAAVAAHHAISLADAIHSLRAHGKRAEVVRARLCRRGDKLVYVLTLLARSGKVIRANVDASSGELATGR